MVIKPDAKQDPPQPHDSGRFRHAARTSARSGPTADEVRWRSGEAPPVRRFDRGRGHGVPVPRRERPLGLLAIAGSGRERGDPWLARRPRRTRGRDVPGPRSGARRFPVRRVSARNRPVRRRVLPDLAARGRIARPAATAAPGAELGGARGRGGESRPADRHPERRLRRDRELRVPGNRPRGRRADRAEHPPLSRHRQPLQHRERPRLVRAGPRGAFDRGRHRLLLVAGRRPPRGGGPGAGRGGPRARGRGVRDPLPAHDRSVRERGDAVADRAVLDLRRTRGRVRAERGLRDAGPQAPERGGGGRRPDLGRHPRIGGEPGRGAPGAPRPEGTHPGAGHRGGAGAGRDLPVRGRLPRSARDRDEARRSDRGERRRRGLRPGPRAGPPAPHGLGEDQHRAPRGRSRGRGSHQAAARDAQRRDPEAPQPPQSQPRDRLGPPAGAGHHGSDGVATRRPAARLSRG